MSVAFASVRPRGKGEVTQQSIQKMLDENHHLIQCIVDYQSKGKTAECTQYQQVLHRNLVYLATIADSNQNMQSLLPAPPTQNMNMGGGGTGQTGNSQSLHSQSNLNDSMATGTPPTPLIQGQINSGPRHTPMQPSGQTSMAPTPVSTAGSSPGSAGGRSHTVTSLQGAQTQSHGPSVASYPSRSNHNMQSNQVTMMHQQAAASHYPSAQAGNQHYQGMLGQGNQGNNIMAQRSMGSYRPSQQGAPAQYMGQDEFYGEQYSHGQSATEPINQQYYPDGHGDYSYQQSSYSEQGYERSFEESSQHYYEGGNSQHNQQQASYQQGANQAAFNQQQYPSQQGYSGQQAAYGSSQGVSSQYPGYPQGQQYSSYRPSQAAPSAQAQRPYGYEQGQYGNYQH